MITVLLVIHLFVTLALIGVVLIQRSEGGGLGIGSSQGMGAFMSGRGTANLLTRTTAVLATIFMLLSLTLALLNRGTSGVGHSILDVPPAKSSAPSGLPVPPAPMPGGSVAPTTGTAPPPATGSTPPASPPVGTAPAVPSPAPGAAAPASKQPSVPTN